MVKLTKKQLEYEIATLVSNIEVYEAFVGDAIEAKKSLALFRAQLHEKNEAELKISLTIENGK